MTVSECLEEIVKEYYKDLAKENEKIKSNWNSLRKYCEENKYFYSGYQGEDREEDLAIKGVLDKMNELEGKDNDGNYCRNMWDNNDIFNNNVMEYRR